MTKQANTHLLILTTIVAIHFATVSFILPILPNLQGLFLVPPMTLGWLEATFAIAHLLALPIMGRLADNFGTRRVLTVSLLGQTLAFLLLALSTTASVLFVSRLISGAASAILPIAIHWVKHHLNEDDRLRGMSYIMLGVTVGAGLGPLASGALGPTTLVPPALVGLIASLIGILFLQRLPDEEEQRQRENAKPNLSRNLIILGVVFLLVSTGFHLYRVLLPFYLVEILGTPVLYAGLAVGGLSIGTALTQAIIARSKPIGKLTHAYLIGASLMSFAFILIATDGIASLVLSLLVLSIGVGLSDPIGGAILEKLSPKNTTGETSGAVFAIGALGKIIGPLLAGAILTYLPLSYGFIMASFIAICGIVLVTKIR
ncbi:MAG: MFS transporter [bacterium]|nr:MFS transporter [bacterium]